ncbi:MAG: hypothetical protein K2G60_04025 [Oscillospiraceae bacterium]|nr:hypothetical protein [Oscillospiraceae bacterium]
MLDNKCPKCGEKLSLFYLKQECPKCKTNLLYYGLEDRLEQDRIKAEKEANAVKNFLYRLKLSSIGGKWQIIRLVLLFSPLLCMLLPVFILKMYGVSDYSFTLHGVIIDFIKGEVNFNAILIDKQYLLPLLTFVFIIVFSLAVIISSLFSCGKKALTRNIVFSIINLAVLSVMTALCIVNGLGTSAGLYIIFAEYILTFAMHYLCNKEIKSRIEVK